MKRITMLLFALCLAVPAEATRKGLWADTTDATWPNMSGRAFVNLKTHATGAWTVPNLKLQQCGIGGDLIGGALYAVRRDSAALKSRVRDEIMRAKRSLDSQAEYDTTDIYQGFALARNLSGVVIAADIIDLAAFDPTASSEFSAWLATIVDEELADGHSVWGTTLRKMAESAGLGIGFQANASLLAAGLYLGDQGIESHAWRIFQAYTDRAAYPDSAWVPANRSDYDYFTVNGVTPRVSWLCGGGQDQGWTVISGSCTKTNAAGGADSAYTCNPSGSCSDSTDCVGVTDAWDNSLNIDGALVVDMSRTCGSNAGTKPFHYPPDSVGFLYSQGEAMVGLVIQAELLYRHGYTTAYTRGSNALKRAMDFLMRAGWRQHYINANIPVWVLNYRYGQTWPACRLSGPTFATGFTDWTHSGSNVPCGPSGLPDQSGPDGNTARNFTAVSSESGTSVTLTWDASACTCDSYDVRVSAVAFGHSGYPSQLPIAASEPKPSYVCGTQESVVESGLCPGTAYWFGIRYHDSWGNSYTDTASVNTLGAVDPECAVGMSSIGKPRDEGEPSVEQTIYTVREARERKDLYDLNGRKAKVSRPGVYFQRVIGKDGTVLARRTVVVTP